MELGLQISGTMRGLDLGRVAEWFARERPDLPVAADQPLSPQRLSVRLHPAADPLELVRGEAPDTLVAIARTSTAGPGYHAHVCDLLDAVGRALSITWAGPSREGDVTGYFWNRDFASLEQQVLESLTRIAQSVEPGTFVNWDPSRPTFDVGAAVHTPMGPRSMEWFAAAANHPRSMVELFPWWGRGTGAGYLLGLALYRMWNDVRWRPPINDDEEELLQNVADTLEEAESQDPTRAYPWREWDEILKLLGDDSELSARVARKAAATPEGPRIGYRRYPMRVPLGGGWSIQVPGSFNEEWDPQGTWSATDGKTTVWCTSYRIREPVPPDVAIAKERAALEKTGLPVTDWRSANLVGVAAFGPAEEHGRTVQVLRSNTIGPGTLMLCTVAVPTERDREMALGIWRSLALAQA